MGSNPGSAWQLSWHRNYTLPVVILNQTSWAAIWDKKCRQQEPTRRWHQIMSKSIISMKFLLRKLTHMTPDLRPVEQNWPGLDTSRRCGTTRCARTPILSSRIPARRWTRAPGCRLLAGSSWHRGTGSWSPRTKEPLRCRRRTQWWCSVGGCSPRGSWRRDRRFCRRREPSRRSLSGSKFRDQF